jgi:uncharacterized protein with NRDE domain
MCTVTYLPKNNGDYILTSSRDEKVMRPSALMPQEYFISGKKIIFPKDPTAGGSWIAYAENRTACLLNGGFEKHTSAPPYKRSRGLVLLDYFSYSDVKAFTTNYNFNGIEPFTLIIIQSNGLFELRWNEHIITILELDSDTPYIWSSVTLYTEEIILKRKNWFQIWLSRNYNYDLKTIRHFHRHAGDGDVENSIQMNRANFMKTVSITSIEKKPASIHMVHEDLISNFLSSKDLLEA